MIPLRALVLPTLLLCLDVIRQSSAAGADGPPVLTVLAPLNHTVTRSASVYVEAVATDDVSANCMINVYDRQISFGDLKLSGTNSVKGHVSSSGTLVFQAIDNTGHETIIVRKFVIEPNSNLVEVATAPGLLLDFAPDRFLCAVSPDPGSYTGAVVRLSEADGVIVDRHSGSQTVIPDIAGPRHNPVRGVLSSNGAVVAFEDYSEVLPNTAIGTWNSGVWTDYGLVGLYQFAGRYAFISPAAPPFRFVLRDIDNPANQYTTTNNNNCCASYSFGPNGDMLLTSDFFLYRNHAIDPANPFGPRTFSTLTYDAHAARTDGTNIVFDGYGITTLLTPTGQKEVLSTYVYRVYPNYLVNNGWVAFVRGDDSSRPQIWVRSPDGQIGQRTYGSTNVLESLGPTGSLTFTRGSDVPPGRYFSRSGSPPWNIGALQGTPKWLPSGELHIMLGRSLFAVRSGHFRALHQTNHPFVAEFSGAPGHHVEVQGSSNLVDWLPVTTFSNISGSVLFTNDSSAPRQFFRTRLLP